jgi:hypothetical protein
LTLMRDQMVHSRSCYMAHTSRLGYARVHMQAGDAVSASALERIAATAHNAEVASSVSGSPQGTVYFRDQKVSRDPGVPDRPAAQNARSRQQPVVEGENRGSMRAVEKAAPTNVSVRIHKVASFTQNSFRKRHSRRGTVACQQATIDIRPGTAASESGHDIPNGAAIPQPIFCGREACLRDKKHRDRAVLEVEVSSMLFTCWLLALVSRAC